MAGKIIADTLETGAGADISTSYVVNGSAKAWVNFNGTGTPAIRNSLNTSSITDNGTGDYDINFTNNFDAASNYTVAGNGNNTEALWFCPQQNSTMLSSDVRMQSRTSAASAADLSSALASMNGDLA